MYKSSQGEIEKELRAILMRGNVRVGGGAAFPRVEVHSFNEGESMDKGMSLRECSVVVESMSTTSKGNAVKMNEDNLSQLAYQKFSTDSFDVIGIVPSSLTTMDETIDTQTILYRVLQTFRLTVKQK